MPGFHHVKITDDYLERIKEWCDKENKNFKWNITLNLKTVYALLRHVNEPKDEIERLKKEVKILFDEIKTNCRYNCKYYDGPDRECWRHINACRTKQALAAAEELEDKPTKEKEG